MEINNELVMNIAKILLPGGDNYYVTKKSPQGCKKGKYWEIGFTNDYPMQHGSGEHIFVHESTIEFIAKNNKQETRFKAIHKPTGNAYWFDALWGGRQCDGTGYIAMLPIEVKERVYKNWNEPDNRIAIDPENCEISLL